MVYRFASARPAMILCQKCQQNEASMHVTDVTYVDAPQGGSQPSVQEQHLCEACAKAANLPHAPIVKKSVGDILKLLQASAQRVRREPSVACPDCGMTLAEFRQRGRLGCPKDYDVFGAHLHELIERVHGSTQHVGRKPGVDEIQLARLQKVSELKLALENAIRDEAYESAARIRDELRGLQSN